MEKFFNSQYDYGSRVTDEVYEYNKETYISLNPETGNETVEKSG